jgi:hypothetical protein
VPGTRAHGPVEREGPAQGRARAEQREIEGGPPKQTVGRDQVGYVQRAGDEVLNVGRRIVYSKTRIRPESAAVALEYRRLTGGGSRRENADKNYQRGQPAGASAQGPHGREAMTLVVSQSTDARRPPARSAHVTNAQSRPGRWSRFERRKSRDSISLLSRIDPPISRDPWGPVKERPRRLRDGQRRPDHLSQRLPICRCRRPG